MALDSHFASLTETPLLFDEEYVKESHRLQIFQKNEKALLYREGHRLSAKYSLLNRSAAGFFWVREQRALSDDVRRSLRRRQRSYEQVWREVVARQRDDLGQPEIAVVVTSTLALLNSTALFDTTLPPDRLGRLLRRMALAALTARRTPSLR